MHQTAHLVFELARTLWAVYLVVGCVILYWAWNGATRWAKSALLIELAIGAALGTAGWWLPADGHDSGWDLLGATAWSLIGLLVASLTAILALIIRKGLPRRSREL